MKKIRITVLLLLIATCSWSQDNYYPTSGNIKVFAQSEAWSEGILIVRPSSWSGIRFARVNPSGGNYNGNWAIGYNGYTGNDFSISTAYNGIQYDGLLHISNSTRNVGIGTITPDEKLSVNGKIHTKEVRVDLTGWSDFVFAKDYDLPTLKEVEQHIQEKGHLKDIPSAKEVEENGILLGDMNAKLLQKIEELTLYVLSLKKENEEQNELLIEQAKNIQELKSITNHYHENKQD